MKPLIIGIGNRWRCDDGVGPRAIEELAERLPPTTVDMMALDGEPARIVAAWHDRPWVLVIDAVRTGGQAGTIHRVDGHAITGPSPRAASSHGAGVGEAINLARALDDLPDQLVVVGVEPESLGDGEDFSPPVAAAFGRLVERVQAEVQAACA